MSSRALTLFLKALLWALVGISPMGALLAQDFEIEEGPQEEEAPAKRLLRYLNAHASGSLNYGHGFFGHVSLDVKYLNLSFADQVGIFSGKVEGQYYMADYEMEGQLRKDNPHRESSPSDDSPGDSSQQERPPEKLFTYSDQGWNFLEIYGKLDLLQNLSLSYGKRRILWGQLDIFSPIDFVLPFDSKSVAVEPSRVAIRLPTKVAQATYFPTSRLELSAYYFPEFHTDPALEEYIFHSEERVWPLRVPRDRPPPEGQREERKVQIARPTGSDGAQHAARVMYYGDWATVGLTYYTGPGNEKVKRPRIEGDKLVPYPQLARFHVYGLEFSKTWTDWSVKFDGAYTHGGEKELRDGAFYFYEDQHDSSEVQAFEELVKEIREKNEGRAYIPKPLLMMGGGVDYITSRWSLNFYFYMRQEILLSRYKKLLDLSHQVEMREGDEDDFEAQFFPLLNVARKFQKNDFVIGLAGGFLGTGVGVGLYTKATFWNRLSVGGSAQYIKDQVISELINDAESSEDRDYDIEKMLLGGRIFASLKF